MSQAIYVPDDVYAILKQLADERSQTIEDLVRSWAVELRVQETAPLDVPAHYDPAMDPLAEYLGAFEAIAPDDVERHDEFFGAPDADAGK